MNNPEISVVLPVYNGGKFLNEAIESIISQTYDNFEFIIINDGSTDQSLNIINDYAAIDSRIRVISRENKGLVYSLNEGIDLAKGKYIARMDADDISLPERFELQYNFMEKHSDITILGTFIDAFGDDEETCIHIEKWFNEKINDKNEHIKASRGCPVPHPTVMMKTDFAKSEGYSDLYPTMEDYELWIRAISKGYKISNLDIRLLKYRVHSKSKSHTEKGKIAIEHRIDCKLKYFFDKKNKNVLLWGAGSGGRIFVNYIQSSKWNNLINIISIVDKEKVGDINNINIIKPNEIENYTFDYILITSAPGYDEICEFLNYKGFKIIEDYIFIL